MVFIPATFEKETIRVDCKSLIVNVCQAEHKEGRTDRT